MADYLTGADLESYGILLDNRPACEKSEKSPLASPPYLLVRDPAGLQAVAQALDGTEVVGLDTETTGLHPQTDRVRLLSLSLATIDGGTFVYLVDCFAVDPSPLWEALAAKELVIHHAAFDLAFLVPLGFVPGVVHDTRLLAQLLAAGTSEMYRCSLEDVVKQELGRQLDKTHQTSDWAGPLTAEQLRYAATDAAVLAPLFEALTAKAKDANLERATEIERRCLPGLVWVAQNGVAFDCSRWEALAEAAQATAAQTLTELDRLAPPKPGCLAFECWNWESTEQVKQVFGRLGFALEQTDEEILAGVGHPLATLVLKRREAQKKCTTYGKLWLAHLADDGRVYADWKQCGAKTGRMACSNPNLQNLPGDPAYRQCFTAPPGRVLVSADYSQIELRIAAKVAGEQRMIEAYRRGEDLHTMTARSMTGRQNITPAERKLAKPVNFGLIYGLGAASLSRKAKAEYGIDLSVEDARRYRESFFRTYPAIQSWHNRIKRQKAKETRTLAGRRVLVEADGFFGGKANYVVQGTGGDGVKLALALLWERHGEVPGAFPVMVIHDEIVVECDQGQAEAAAMWLRQAMLDGMAPLIEPVPVEVEVKVARTWAGGGGELKHLPNDSPRDGGGGRKPCTVTGQTIMPFSGTAKNKGAGGGNFPLVPAGNHPAVLVAMIDLGTQQETNPGNRNEYRDVHQVYLVWELTHAQIEGRQDNHLIGRKYTLSYHESATLRQMAETLRGKPYAEGDPIDYARMLGSKCLLEVVHGTAKTSGNTYAKIKGISSVPKSMTVPAARREPFLFDLEGGDPKDLPDWLPWILGESVFDVVIGSKEWRAGKADESSHGSEVPHAPGDSAEPPDEIPF
jgi:DNA polymerase-1